MTSRIAWITGGGTGIGRAVAEALYHRGYSVFISGRRSDVVEEAAKVLNAQEGPGKIFPIQADVSRPDDVTRVLASLGSTLHLLINNAGWNPNHRLQETSLEELRKALEINCIGALECAKQAIPLMPLDGRSAIVNISSVLGKWASAGSAAYSISKYAMTGLTDLLRQTLVGSRIHVMGVFPGFIETAMTAPFVQPGTLKSKLGHSPGSMAKAILKGLDCRVAEVHYPWYVPWVLRFHRSAPAFADSLAVRFKR